MPQAIIQIPTKYQNFVGQGDFPGDARVPIPYMTRQGTADSSREAEGRYRDLALACDQAVILCAEGRIVFANDAAVGLLGATQPAQILGQELRLFVTHDLPDAAVASGSEHRVHVQLPITRLDGAAITASLAWMPCR